MADIFGVIASGLAISAVDKAKAYTDQKISDMGNVYRFKGSVASKSTLPSTGNTPGDVWNALDSDINYAWTTQNTWDALGGGTFGAVFVTGKTFVVNNGVVETDTLVF